MSLYDIVGSGTGNMRSLGESGCVGVVVWVAPVITFDEGLFVCGGRA